jgi:glucose-1-phosphate thymidylyltransferase
MKGILLAGGHGTRLSPITINLSKQLIGVYDKPAFYYPLSTLILAGCKKIAVISSARDIDSIRGNIELGGNLGIEFEFLIQDFPGGIPQAYIIAEEFLAGDSSLMVLGDNFFHGNQFGQSLRDSWNFIGAKVFAYPVRDPSKFAVVEIGKLNEIISIEEKPISPKSNYAIPGIYFFDGNATAFSKELVPSARGELEIVDLITKYKKLSHLEIERVSRGTAWLDMGTPNGLLETAEYVKLLQSRQGLMIGSPHEATVRAKNILAKDLLKSISNFKSDYFSQIQQILLEQV